MHVFLCNLHHVNDMYSNYYSHNNTLDSHNLYIRKLYFNVIHFEVKGYFHSYLFTL